MFSAEHSIVMVVFVYTFYLLSDVLSMLWVFHVNYLRL